MSGRQSLKCFIGAASALAALALPVAVLRGQGIRPATWNSSPARSSHWSFQPVRRPVLPAVENSAWCITPVDRFILAKLEANGLNPAPPADRRTLIRRLTFDLIGLPPTP